MIVERSWDRLLDRAVVPGYSAVGYRLRRRTWPEDDPRPGSLRGKRALVTGAGSGLGEAVALGLARLGATVHLLARSEERARPAADRIARALAGEADLHLEACDVSDLADVRRFAEKFRASYDGLDLLIHNAGVLPQERRESVDGHELTVATHVLGPVLLTEELRGVLRPGARVVLVSSGGMYSQALPLDDLEYEHGTYRGATAYARSKRMQVELTPVLAERLAEDGVSVHAMHPGWADTPGVADSLPAFRLLTRPVLRDAEAGADTIVWLAATEPAPESGRFWHDRAPRPTALLPGTAASEVDVRRLWNWVREQTGIR